MYRVKTLRTYVSMCQSEGSRLDLWVMWIRRGLEVSGQSGIDWQLCPECQAVCHPPLPQRPMTACTNPASFPGQLPGGMSLWSFTYNSPQIQQTHRKREADVICCQDRCLEMFLLILSLNGDEQCLQRRGRGCIVQHKRNSQQKTCWKAQRQVTAITVQSKNTHNVDALLLSLTTKWFRMIKYL